MEFFENIPVILNKLKVLQDVGLGYLKLGQPSTTISGGESQRVKLATELAKRDTGKTLYILDEPTTGLHLYDIDKLVKILYRLVESGNTIVVIEHNLDVIKCADYICHNVIFLFKQFEQFFIPTFAGLHIRDFRNFHQKLADKFIILLLRK